jgi:type III secretory pathway component EscT
MMTQIKFILTDFVQVMKLVIIISVPIAIVVSAAVLVFLKRAKRR